MHEDARDLVAEEIARLRALDYSELLRYEGHALHCDVHGASGEVLNRETQVFWDDRKRQNLRVVVDVSRPLRRRGWIGGSLVVDDFIRSPNGSFVGE